MAILQYLSDKHQWCPPAVLMHPSTQRPCQASSRCRRRGRTDLYPTDLKTPARINMYMHYHHRAAREATIGPAAPPAPAQSASRFASPASLTTTALRPLPQA